MCPLARPLVRLAAPLLVLTASAHAADFTVGPAGSGADFTDVQSAIDAAGGSFDRVFVLPGTYVGTITITKDVDLIGSGPDTCALQPSSDVFLTAQPNITVRDLGPNERVRIAGFALEPADLAVFSVTNGALRILDCAGPVTLAELRVGGSGLPSTTDPLVPAALEIANSERVIVDRCSLTAPTGSLTSLDPPAARAGVSVSSSRVWINDSSLTGGKATASPFTGPSRGGAGLEVQDSEVTLAWSTVAGGPGDSEADTTGLGTPPTSGGPGILLRAASSLQVDGGAAVSIAGGLGGFDPASGMAWLGGVALVLEDQAVATTSLGVQLSGGLDGTGLASAPILELQPGSMLTLLPFATTALRTSATRPLPGESFELEVAGAPNALIGIFSDNQTISPLPLPGFLGAALIGPAVSETLIPVLTDGTGRATKAVQVPILAPAGARRYLQAVLLEGLADPSISAPAFATVGF